MFRAGASLRLVIDAVSADQLGAVQAASAQSPGSLDTSFAPSISGGDGAVYALAVQSDGRIVIGGGFSNVNGVGRSRIARLSANGSVDTSFDPGAGVGGAAPSVQAMAVQSDGRVLAACSFPASTASPAPRWPGSLAAAGVPSLLRLRRLRLPPEALPEPSPLQPARAARGRRRAMRNGSSSPAGRAAAAAGQRSMPSPPTPAMRAAGR
ncbi:MAG: hypothetical protein CFK52_14050 [Chloracidobacterium sp. CP2_5A]|nr:MAG: hypothetical protein CFK52_14050 [Chloracidobacterium sp. CP2_5A]